MKFFALTLNFYSNRAYEYVRQKFGKHLPSQSTLRNWYRSIDGNPGVLTESLNVIKHRVNCAKQSGKTIFLALMLDEMSIKRQVIWNEQLKKFVGYVDYGTGCYDENSEEATEALVFLVNAVNEKWKVPIAYYYTNKLSGQDKANIINELLIHLNGTGAEIISLTFDGAPSNISMANILGANLKNGENLKTYFLHPCTKEKIFVFLDMCHMLKLVRNIFATKAVIYTDNDKTIKWNYILQLETLQRNDLKIANKLTKKHVQFHNNKMRVKLAAQTVSNSVADSLQYLKSKNPIFKDCQSTIQFLKIFNNLFDVFNSKTFYSHGFKRPLNGFTKREYFDLFDEAKKYILSLKIDEKIGVDVNNQIVFEKINITKTNSKTGFLGFLIAIESFKQMYTELIENNRLSFLIRYKFSQDHLETVFSIIRAHGGFNNNPNCVQFRRIMKRILMQNEIKASLSGNCEPDSTSILTTRSHDIKRTEVNPDEVYDEEDEEENELFMLPLTETTNDVVIYIAGFVERHIKKFTKCTHCLDGLNGYDVMYGEIINIKNNGGLIHPQTNIYKICRNTESLLRSTNTKNPRFYPTLVSQIFRSLDTEISKMFSNATHNVTEQSGHKVSLIKKIIEYYLKIRLHLISDQITTESKKNFVRSKFTKLIHFYNQ